MNGLSPATVERLAQLEAQPELQSVERGELRSMTHSRPTGDERMRVERLLATAPPTTPPPGETPPPPGGAAYRRGIERGSAQGGKAYTSTKEN